MYPDIVSNIVNWGMGNVRRENLLVTPSKVTVQYSSTITGVYTIDPVYKAELIPPRSIYARG